MLEPSASVPITVIFLSVLNTLAMTNPLCIYCTPLNIDYKCIVGYHYRIMWKRLAMLIALAVVLIAAIVFFTCKNERSAEDYQQENLNKSYPAATLPTHQSGSRHQAKNSNQKPACWQILLAWPTGITTWAILLTLFVISWQSWATARAAKATDANVEEVRRQAGHMAEQTGVLRDSVAAARESADGWKESERAWVLIGSDMDTFSLVEDSEPCFKWFIKNSGRSPARIIETQCVYELVHRSKLGTFPLTPPSDDPIYLNELMIVPNDSMPFSMRLTGAGGGREEVSGCCRRRNASDNTNWKLCIAGVWVCKISGHFWQHKRISFLSVLPRQ